MLLSVYSSDLLLFQLQYMVPCSEAVDMKTDGSKMVELSWSEFVHVKLPAGDVGPAIPHSSFEGINIFIIL